MSAAGIPPGIRCDKWFWLEKDYDLDMNRTWVASSSYCHLGWDKKKERRE